MSRLRVVCWNILSIHGRQIFVAKKCQMCYYLEIIKMLVTVGLGWSALPRTMVDASLAALNVRGLTLRRDLGVVRHNQHTLTGAARAFVDVLLAAVEDEKTARR